MATTYYSGWQDWAYTCKHCAWSGLGKDLVQGEAFAELYEADCPTCHEPVEIVSYPTIQESRENWDKVSPGDRLMVQIVERSLMGATDDSGKPH